jgi:hypothetical protein
MLRKGWMLVVGAMLLGLLAAPPLASAYTYSFTAWIDDRSDLIIQANTVQWHNITGFIPGGTIEFYPTTISTPDFGPYDWYPNFGGASYGEAYSDKFTGLTLPLASVDQTSSSVTLTYTGRNSVSGASIMQYPNSSNSYALIVEIYDPDLSFGWYTVNVTALPGAVPLPGTLAMTASGLMALGGLAWRCRRF